MIKSLSYVGFRSPNSDEWASFGPEIFGAQLVTPPASGEVRLRVDEKVWRIAIHPGETNELAYIGWEVDGVEGLSEAIELLLGAGITVHSGDAALCRDRSVEGLAWFLDPFGFRHELSYGREIAPDPFQPGRPISGFVTGDGGLGHIVLIVPDLDLASEFYLKTLGFSHSDDIEIGMLIRFAHCNPRHHSLAFTAVPGMVGVHHLMLEVADVDDVGRAYDLVNERAIPVAMTLGRHTNDHMTSFYVRTPSGFEVEYGSGGRRVDPSETLTPRIYNGISIWGHKPPAEPLIPGILKSAELER